MPRVVGWMEKPVYVKVCAFLTDGDAEPTTTTTPVDQLMRRRSMANVGSLRPMLRLKRSKFKKCCFIYNTNARSKLYTYVHNEGGANALRHHPDVLPQVVDFIGHGFLLVSGFVRG